MVIKKQKSNGGLIGIDIGSTSIKKLELSRSGGKLRVDDYAVYPLPEGAVVDKSVEKLEVVVAALEAVMKTSKANSTGIAFAIPSSYVSTHIERMEPDLSDQEVQANVNAKVTKIIPFPVSELAMDYMVVDALYNLKPVREVTIVAAKNDPVKSKQELFELAGIKTNVATTESFAVEKVLSLITTPSDKHSILFDFGFSNTIIYAILNNKIVYARDHEFGGVRMARMIRDYYSVDADEVEDLRDQKLHEQDHDFIEYILKPFLQETTEQFNQALQLCMSSTDITEVDQVLLSGGSARLDGLVDAAHAELGYPVRIACPFDQMEFAPSVDREEFNKDRALLLTVCGLALCDIGDSVNLLPWREALEQQKKRSYLTGLMAAGLVGVAVALGGWVSLKAGYSNHTQATANVQSQMDVLDKKLAEYEQVTTLRDQMLERMKLIQGLQSQRPVMVEVANSIVKAIPMEAYLVSVSKDGSVFTFIGKSKDIEVVAEYMRNMKATGLFSDVFMSNYESFKQPKEAEDKKAITKEEDRYGEFTLTATLSDYTELKDAAVSEPEQDQIPEPPTDNSGFEVAESAPVEVGEPAPTEVGEPAPVVDESSVGQPPVSSMRERPTTRDRGQMRDRQVIPMQDQSNGGV